MFDKVVKCDMIHSSTTQREDKMNYKHNDGGRQDAGFKGTAGDCGTRAMAIALGLDYKTVYKELAQANADNGRAKSARNGINKDIYSEVLKRYGWVWMQSPKFIGRKARCSDMPSGVVIAKQALVPLELLF